jgi:RHS repeat-associated protein
VVNNGTRDVDYRVDGSSNSGLRLTFLRPGSYAVDASCNTGGTPARSQIFTVYAPPTVTLAVSSVSVEPYDKVTLTASGGNSYLWIGEGIPYTTGPVVEVFPTKTTTYQVAAIGQGVCQSSYQSVTVNVVENPDPYNWEETIVYGETLQEQTATTNGTVPATPNTHYSAQPLTLPTDGQPLQITPASPKNIFVSKERITVLAGGQVSVGPGGTLELVIGEVADAGTVVVPGEQTVVGASRTYLDFFGRVTQSQSRQMSTDNRLVTQTLYDSYGMGVGQTLAAPVGSGGFAYQQDFVTRNNQPYGAAHFDDAKTLNPDPVDNATPGTLGWYYSDNNTWEPYVDKTSYPYSRSYTAPNGTVSRGAGAGDQHRMGMNRETRAAAVPLLNELDAHYLKVRNLYVSTEPNASLRYRGSKSVAVDINGREAVSFADRDGKVLASCRTDASFAPITLSGSIDAAAPVDANGNYTPRYLDIHIPRSPATTLVTITGTGQIRIYNEADGSIVYNDGAVANQTLVPGIYRIVSLSGSQTVSYPARYGEFSYQIYDDAGRQLASIAPKGVDLTVIPATRAAVTFETSYQVAANGDMLKATSTDEGAVEYVYRRDGTLRFSQNAQQKIDKKFSYVNYDRLGRTLQSGVYQLANTANTTPTLEEQLQTLWGGNYNAVLENRTRTGGLDAANCREITDSYYDAAATDLPTQAGSRRQRFLIGAVSKTQNAHVTTWYSYDELGQTEWMIQDIAGLGVKLVDYRYDRNGQLREAAFQKDVATERFSHFYTYDADLRLSQVHTSRDGGASKMLQATYLYYRHGPLKRVELADKLQGIDYVYTLQGWLKSINHPDGAKDPGKDGIANTANAAFAPDAFGMTLEYFSGDYTRAATGIAHQEVSGYESYYSGRIKAMSWRTQKPQAVLTTQGAAMADPTMQAYRYDAKYQLTEAVWGGVNLTAAPGTNVFTATNFFKETIAGYDAHGNITGLQRTDAAGALKHNFTYRYGTGSDRLERIDGYTKYTYDALGQMTSQEKDADASPALNHYLEYDAAGMVVAVYSDAARMQRKVSYAYDEGGLRVKKVNHVTNITTYYVNGIVYDNENTTGNAIVQKEVPLQGSGRIGVYRTQEDKYVYELSDHLGNVRAVIAAVKVNAKAEVLEYSDYYAIGGVARAGGELRYRHGYQGQYAEKDRETEWNSFELRMYDPLIGRWLSPDPYGQYHSPYLAMGNDWVNSVDPDGGWTDPIYGVVNGVKTVTINGVTSALLGEAVVTATRLMSAAAPAAGAVSGGLSSLTGRAPMIEQMHYMYNAVLHDMTTVPGTPQGQEIVPLAQAGDEFQWKAQQDGHDLAAKIAVGEMLLGALMNGVGVGGSGPTAGASLTLSATGAFIFAHGLTVTLPNAMNGLENSFNRRQVNSKKWEDGDGGSGFEKMGKQKGSSAEKMPRDVAKKLGINERDFSKYIHKIKQKKGMGGADNFTWDELMELGEDFKAQRKK